MRHIQRTVLAIIVVILAALYIDLPGTKDFFGRAVGIAQGIDLAGGSRLLLCAPKNSQPSTTDMDIARGVINARAAGGFGVTEPQVTRVGTSCISAELPGLRNGSSVMQAIGKTGYLAMTDGSTQQLGQGLPVTLSCPPSDPKCAPGAQVGPTNLTAKPRPILQVIVPGRYIQQGSAQTTFSSTTGTPAVDYAMTGSGSAAWCTYTSTHVQGLSAIVLDGKIISDLRIQGAICNGRTEISQIQSTDQAKQLATYLNYGALPVPLHVDSSEQVSASLGPQYVHDAWLAGIIGLIIVALFMLLYYRLPGLLADIALLMYTAVSFALFKYLGVTMTLTAVAGFILSIGMAVDANVLIAERMKEELRAGKTLGLAVEAGFKRAWPSIRDSNASTMITCVILFIFGRNFAATVITGFATTLFIGVAVSMLTAVFVSHTFLRLLVLSGYATTPPLFGLEEGPDGQTWNGLNIVGKRYWYFLLSLLIIVPGTFSLVTSGLKLGTDFTGGTEMTIQIPRSNQSTQIASLFRGVTGNVNFVQSVLGAKCPTDCRYIARTKTLSPAQLRSIEAKLKQQWPSGRVLTQSTVSGTIASQLTQQAIIAVAAAALAILLYISFAFRNTPNPVRFGAAALVAMLHDVLVVLGLFSILGTVLNVEVDAPFITAMLTIIGFSVHDTIVIFDRIRENLSRRTGEAFEVVVNHSILQSFVRSINTSFTVVLTLLAIFVFTGEAIRFFVLAMLVGVISGTYSSIFNASQILVVWHNHEIRSGLGRLFRRGEPSPARAA